jgi:hypothetical protein
MTILIIMAIWITPITNDLELHKINKRIFQPVLMNRKINNCLHIFYSNQSMF